MKSNRHVRPFKSLHSRALLIVLNYVKYNKVLYQKHSVTNRLDLALLFMSSLGNH